MASEDTSVEAQVTSRIKDRLYAPLEMAYIVGLERETIQRKCAQGKIIATKVGMMWRITGEEIRRYLREGDKK